MASLRLVGVRDWRVYGAFALWPSVIGEIRVSHLTPVLCLLAALAWRYRERRFAPGVGVRARERDQVLPLAARRVARRDRASERARSLPWPWPAPPCCSSCRSPGSTTTSTRLLELGRTFDQESYYPFGFLVQLGAPSEVGRAATFVLGAALLVGCWRWRSLALAVAAALVLSPIVWLDYYAIAAVPLAVVRPRLSLGLVRSRSRPGGF